MKKFIGILFFIVTAISCDAQNNYVKNLSENIDLNYLLASVLPEKTVSKDIFNGGLYVKVFQLNDTKATEKEMFDGYDGVASSFLVSVMPDGDYYTTSKLFKIEGLVNPIIKSISESSYPEFIITIEYGLLDEKKIKEFKFKGN